MGKTQENYRLVVDVEKPWIFSRDDAHKEWLRRLDEVESEIKRHVDGVSCITQEWDEVCEYCGAPWESIPWCCNKTMEEASEDVAQKACKTCEDVCWSSCLYLVKGGGRG